MQEHEMILEILQSEGKPVQAKYIAKEIYNKFDGYKLHRTKVRNYLWKELKPLVVYDKDDYTYSLVSNAKYLRDFIFYKKNSQFNFIIEHSEPEKGVNRLYDYKVEGTTIKIISYIENATIEEVLKSLVLAEILSISDQSTKKSLNRIKQFMLQYM